MRFQKSDDEYYRIRAQAYKRLGHYRDELKDRMIVKRLNPNRQYNYLPIIEDFILLKKYTSAENWINKNINNITKPDIKTMFHFFEILCKILLAKDYSSDLSNFKKHVNENPLRKKFKTKFWEFDFIEDFIKKNPISESIKNEVNDIIKLLKDQKS